MTALESLRILRKSQMIWEGLKKEKEKSCMRKDKGGFTWSKESRHSEQFAPAAGVLFLPLV